MSIAPPSDIILDVARAADPERLRGATAKLDALAAGAPAAGQPVAGAPARPAPGDFAALLARAAPPAAPAPTAPPPAHAGAARPGLSPYQKFEAVLLQTFVQEMLPKDADLFGDAASADAYRGMMAEQLAEQLARSGGIGLAKAIEKAEAARTAPPDHHAGAAASPGSGGPDRLALRAPERTDG